MKKLLLIMLASLFMMMSCDILSELDGEEDKVEYTTLTEAEFDKVAPYVFGISLPDAADTELDAVEGTGTTIVSGTGYTGTITVVDENTFSATITATFENEPGDTESDDNYTYSGSFITNLEVFSDMTFVGNTDMPITGRSSWISELVFDITLANAEVSSIKGNLKVNTSFTADEALAVGSGFEPDTIYTGTLVIDGKNYKASEFGVYIDATSDDVDDD